MQMRITLSKALQQSLIERLQRAYTSGQLRLVKRIHALLMVIEGKACADAAAVLGLGEQTQMGFSFQKARFVSDHLNEAARLVWRQETWPAIQRLARTKGALILFGDEASFAHWGSLSYTWARKGQQPTVKTAGKRKADKVFGLIEFTSGRLCWQGHTGRFNAQSYADFLTQVLAQTSQHLILIQDGANYHISKVMQAFFVRHRQRLTVFQLPAYSPDFNPIEFLWKKLKKLATHLKYFPTFAALTTSVERTLHYFAARPAEILALMGCYAQSFGASA